MEDLVRNHVSTLKAKKGEVPDETMWPGFCRDFVTLFGGMRYIEPRYYSAV